MFGICDSIGVTISWSAEYSRLIISSDFDNLKQTYKIIK